VAAALIWCAMEMVIPWWLNSCSEAAMVKSRMAALVHGKLQARWMDCAVMVVSMAA